MGKTSGKYRFMIIYLLVQIFIVSAMAQDNLPEKPILNYVTVDTSDQNIILNWDPVTTSDILYYKIYSVEISGQSIVGTYIDSVFAGVNSYKHIITSHESLMYTVTAVDSIGESLLGNDYHQAVKVNISYDSCSQEMNLEWNSYVGWKGNLNGYRVFCKEEGGDFNIIALLDTASHSYAHIGIKENSNYEYLIRAFDNQGRSSFSNRRSYFTRMPAPPAYINLDYVSVLDDQNVEISFTADLSGEINDFRVLKATSSEASFTDWTTILDVAQSPYILNDKVATRGVQIYYRIDAINSCLSSVSSSNIGTNIVLRGEIDVKVAKLNWNPYKEFSGSLEAYYIYRMNSTNEYELIHSVSSEYNTFIEDLSQLGHGIMKGEVSYQVVAKEANDNPYGVAGLSRSNELTLNIESKLFVPTAFSPNGEMNKKFVPVMDFIPSAYRMLIYDRTGKILYQTSDPFDGWDGTLYGSTMARRGVYIYHIEYTSYSGVRKVLTGNLSLVNP